MHRFFLLVVLGLCGCGLVEDRFECKLTEAEFLAQVEKAQECSAGDTCVMARAACTCNVPVHSDYVEEIEACSPMVECTTVLDCSPVRDPRCENGRCTGTRD